MAQEPFGFRSGPAHAALASGVLFAAMVGASIWAERAIGPGLLPHGVCFTWIPSLLWLHVLSDALIGLAYVSIPLTLWHFVRRRTDLPFNWMFLLFGLFIVSCGITHFMAIWTVWNPSYWLDGAIKAFTGAASVLTAVALLKIVPRALELPTVEQLRRAKEALEREVAMRRAAEDELRQAQAALERRVEERTHALQQATTSLEAERAQAVAARAQAEEARVLAEAANRQKDEFLARVSHELRTPLQSTLSWVQVLGRSYTGSEESQIALRRLSHNVQAQARMIDDLLDISRILSGKLHLELQEVHAVSPIARALDMQRPAADARRVQVSARLPDGDGLITTDPTRLEQVVANLLANAIAASDDGGRVEVDTTIEDGRLRIVVRDWGYGLSPDEASQIFQPFRQGRRGVAGRKGLGLGLAITRSIVGLLGGSIDAYSDGPGTGATFTVDLPAHARGGRSTPGAPELSHVDLAALARIRVLYVEDDRDVADPAALMLSDLGVRVEVRYTFDSALAEVRRGEFDVLLSDLDLGGPRSGYDLVRALGESPGQRVPAVALSAYGGSDHQRRTREAGFSMLLVKPVTAVEIADALLRATGAR